MNPFFFGSSERALFGAYHAPKTQPARNAGVDRKTIARMLKRHGIRN